MPWTPSLIFSSFAPLQTGGGVPFSRELLVNLGWNYRVPPRGAAVYLFDRRTSVVATARILFAGAPAPGSCPPEPTGQSAESTYAVVVFDPQEMVARFRQRAEAVRTRGVPPIEGPERQRFREQAQQDFTDYAMIGDAEAELVDGILTLRIDLRPKTAPSDPS